MSKPKLTGKRAIWLGLVGTPVALVAVVAGLGVGASAAGGSSSSQASKVSAAPVTVSSQATASATATAAYWTPAKMAAAQPLLAQPPASSDAKAVVAGSSATGSPGAAGGILPDGTPMNAPAVAKAAAASSTGIVPADGGYPGPYTGFKWYPRYRTYPVSTISKVFFSQDVDGNGSAENYVCSAAVTYGGVLNSVWTAGHCVNNGLNGSGYNAGWSYNVLVCPSYVNGVNPAVGCWAYTSELVSFGWYTYGGSTGAWSRDMGAYLVSPTGTVISDQIVNAVGGLGFGWNWGRDQSWMDFGYPAQPSAQFDGGAINTCASEHRYDITTDGQGPATNSIGCNSGRGSSGGPWILGFSQYGGLINSVNSWLYLAEEGSEMQGPYYDTVSCAVWKDVTAWGGTC